MLSLSEFFYFSGEILFLFLDWLDRLDSVGCFAKIRKSEAVRVSDPRSDLFTKKVSKLSILTSFQVLCNRQP